MFAKFFIERPVLANVIAPVTMLLGGVAMVNLPVALADHEHSPAIHRRVSMENEPRVA